jgi:phenylacetate-CoA ligase
MMVGPAAPAVGGMVSVIDGLMDGPLGRSCELLRYSTNRRTAPATTSRLSAPRWLAGAARHARDGLRFAARIVRTRPDIVHLHTCSGFSFHRSLIDLATARLLGRRVLLHIHGGRFEQFCAESGSLGRWAIRRGCGAAEAVLVLSHRARRGLCPQLGDAARVVVVPNAVSIPLEQPATRQSAATERREICRFLFLGAMTTAKGVGDLIDAAGLLRERGVAFELLLVGPCDEGLGEEWRRRVAQRGVADCVRLLGPVDRGELVSLLRSADCLVLPSHGEAMPMVVLEAAACGLPVIATAVGGVPEMVTTRGSDGARTSLATLVPPRDPEALASAMQTMAADGDYRRDAGRRLRAHVAARFSSERQAARLLRLYRRPKTTADAAAPPRWAARSAARMAYRVHERLRGRATLAELGTLRHVVAAGPSAVREDQRRRLQELLDFAERELPFYRDRLAAAGTELASTDPMEALRRFRPLDKLVVRENAAGMTWSRVPGGPISHSSGGTTGDTLRFAIDRTRQAQTLAARLFMQERFGVRLGDRRVYVWGSPIETRGGRLRRRRDHLLNEFMLDAFEMSDRQIDAHLKRLARLRPALIYGYPSALALLARRALDRRQLTKRWRPRLVVLTGEEIAPWQRTLIADAFRCRVAAEYGSREVGLIAHECPHGGLHVIAPHIHVEVLVGGCPVEPGESGELVCTNLNTRAQPLIRYRVGDAGALLDGDCPCRLPFPLMRLDGGKVTGMIALPGGGLCHGAVTSHVLRDLPGVVQFKTHQRSIDCFDVMLVVDGAFRPGAVDTIERRYRGMFGQSIRVNCRIVDRIPPDPSGKRRYVVSDVAPRFAEREPPAAPPALN